MATYYPAPSLATDTLHVTADADVDGNLNVDGAAQIDGNTTIDGDLGVGDDLAVTGDLSAGGLATLGSVIQDNFYEETFLPPPLRFTALTGLALTDGGYYRMDDRSGNLLDVNGNTLTAGGSPTFEKWIGGRRGVQIDGAGDQFTANVFGPGTSSWLYAGAFSMSAHQAADKVVFGYYELAVDVGFILWVKTADDKLHLYISDGGGGHNSDAAVGGAITFGSTYLVLLQLDQAANIARVRLVNMTTRTLHAETTLDITAYASLTGGGSPAFFVGAVTGVRDGQVITHFGLAALTGAQIEGAGVPAALSAALGAE